MLIHYHSYRHAFGTLLALFVPFAFLLFFSRIAHIGFGDLAANLGLSLGRMLIAYVISAVLALVLAISFYRGRRALIALPFFDVLQSLPTTAALPVFALAFGRNDFVVIFFLIYAIIWPIFFSLVTALRGLKPEWEESVRIGGLRGIGYFRHFLLPASVPSLITGSIIGLGDGWQALVATEIIIGIRSGIGPFFQSFASDSFVTILGILALLLIVFSVNRIVWLPLLEYSHKSLEE